MLAYLIGHEMAHFVLGHNLATRPLEDIWNQWCILADLAFSTSPSYTVNADGTVHGVSTFWNHFEERSLLKLRQLQRDNEFAADHMALRVMIRAGYDTEGCIKYTEWQMGRYLSDPLEDPRFATHPPVCYFPPHSREAYLQITNYT